MAGMKMCDFGGNWICGEEKCYWFERSGKAMACRSPKHEWTEEDDAEFDKEHPVKHEFSIKPGLPPFKPERHCDFRLLKPNEEPYYMIM